MQNDLESQPGEKKILLNVFEAGAVSIWMLAVVLGLAAVCASLVPKNAAGTRDFISYWAAGQQVAHHANPYDTHAILTIERGAGFPIDAPVLMMRNPPPALFLVLPLGLTSARLGLILWTLLLLACLVVSVLLLGSMHRLPQLYATILALSFGPAIVCLLAGQISLFVLLGLALFLRLHRTSPIAAGISLWFCALKPHLLLPFTVVLVVWTVQSKSYKILAGAIASILVSSTAILFLNPSVWLQYGHMVRNSGIEAEVMPCLSNLLRRSIRPDGMWLQYVPAALGCIWALGYYRRNRARWNWLEYGSLLTLVSFVVAPYSWMTDQAVLIPALLHGLYVTRSRALVSTLALASSAVQLSVFGGGTRSLHSQWLVWTAPFWLVWYLLATRRELPQPSMLST